jgi:NDP-sugar pyrophosphorylase family protein
MTTEMWVEVGSPARYLDGQLAARHSPAPAGHQPWATIRSSADPVAPDAHLGDDVIMDDTVSLQPGAGAERSVLMERVQVGAGSRLQEVIAGPDTRIPGGLDIRRTVLAPPGGIPAGGLPDNVHLWEGMLRADF